MTYQISMSGGMGSAISALVAAEADLDFQMIFADTLVEDDDLYRFLIDVVCQVRGERPSSGHSILYAMTQAIPPLKKMQQRRKYLKVLSKMAMVAVPGFTWLIDGRTPWDTYVDKKWIGNTRTAHCSTLLKNEPVRQHLQANSPDTDPLVLGMDWSEQDRIERAQANWHPRPVTSLLNKFKIARGEYDLIINRYGIAKPRLYSMGFSHNNCGGYCCKAGLKQFKTLLNQRPEVFDYHALAMDWAMGQIGDTAKPFLRKTVAGEINYITLNEFRDMVQEGEIEVPEFDAEGCGCFIDE